MIQSAEWSLSPIADLSKWLFDGLFAVHGAKTFSDRKYALLPVELNDTDYVFLQIVRQVRTFDRNSLPRLAEANDAAISRWRPSYGVRPLLDMIGLVQELGSRSFNRHLSDLTLPSTLNRMLDSDRDRLFSALVEALIPQSEFHFKGPLYSAFLKLVIGPASLPAAVLARALTALIAKTPADWKTILQDCGAYFQADAEPSESPLGPVFFAVEDNLPREYFLDLFKAGGRANLLPDEVWLIPWLFASRDPSRPAKTPLSLAGNTNQAFWFGFASRPDDRIEVAKGEMPYQVVEAIEREIVRTAGGKTIARLNRGGAGPIGLAQEDEAGRTDDSEVILRPLKSRRA
jgi:hypothetical protein